MLKFFELKEIKKVDVSIDSYIPLNIEFGMWKESLEQTVYWRTGDFENSLIEVGIGKYKKDIRSITIPVFRNVCKMNNFVENYRLIYDGSPAFELKNDGNNYLNEKNELKVYIGKKQISIMFLNSKIKCHIRNGSVDFFVDEKNLFVGFRVNDVSESNRDIFEKAL